LSEENRVNAAAKVWRWISGLGPRPKGLVIAILVLLLSTLVYPFQITIVPAWDLRILDETHAPVGAINVTEHWRHYLFESYGREELRLTAVDGRVSFPERTMRASLLRRAWATIKTIAADGRHARRDAAASVVVWGSKDYETAVEVYSEGVRVAGASPAMGREAARSEIIVHTSK
jgi:hypothetical protein